MKRLLSSRWFSFIAHWGGVVVLIVGAFILGAQLKTPRISLIDTAQACNWVCKCGVCGCDDNASGFAAACAQNGSSGSGGSSSQSKSSSSNSSSSGGQKCDGWADSGSEHRNSGNGCFYTCSNGSWVGPNRCDGQGNGQFQGDAATSTDERARQEEAVRERQQEAEAKVQEQGAEVTAQLAEQTADQRAREAARQQAMVESQRQAAVVEAEARGDQAAIDQANQQAQQASQQVSEAQGTDRGSEIVGSDDLRAREIAAVGYDPNSALALGIPQMSSLSSASQIALANAQVSIANLNAACDVNTGTPNTVGVGGACCRGGVVECGAETNGTCMSEIDRSGVVGFCGAAGQPDTSGYCGDAWCQATENAQSCAQDCAVISDMGARLFHLEGGACIPCSPTVGSSCISLQACLQQSPVVQGFSEQIRAEQARLNQLYQQCYFDIDMIEGTLDPTCVSRIAKLEQKIRGLEAQGALAVQQVRTQVQAERRVYGLIGTLTSLDLRCVGTPCTATKEETQRQLNQAYETLRFFAPDRVPAVEQRGNEHRQDTLDSFNERTQLVNQRLTTLIAEATDCGKNDPDCVQKVQREADLQLRAFLNGSEFCSNYPNAPSCEESVQDVQNRITQIIEELPEEREEASSCSQGTYETEEACDAFGSCVQLDDGCWQPNQVTERVDSSDIESQGAFGRNGATEEEAPEAEEISDLPPLATVPVVCEDGTPLNSFSNDGRFYCNQDGELEEDEVDLLAPTEEVPGTREFQLQQAQLQQAQTNLRTAVSTIQSILRGENPIQTEAVRLYPNEDSCTQAGWSQCQAVVRDGATTYQPRANASFHDPNPFRSFVATVTGRRGTQSGVLSLNENQALQRVEEGRCHGSNASAGSHVLINGNCYQTDTRSELRVIPEGSTNACVSDANTYRTLVNGLCLATRRDQELSETETADTTADEPAVNFGDFTGEITQMQEAVVEVESINSEIAELESLRLERLASGQRELAATLQLEIEELISRRQTLATQELRATELSPLSRIELAQRIQESNRRTEQVIREQRQAAQQQQASEAQRLTSLQQEYTNLLSGLSSQTENVRAYNATRAQLEQLETEVQTVCPEQNRSAHCQALRQQVVTGQETITQSDAATARNAFTSLQRSLQQALPENQRLTPARLQRTYLTPEECVESGWSQCEARVQGETNVYQPTSEATYSDPHLIRRVLSAVAQTLPRTQNQSETIQQHALTPAPAGRCHSSNASAATHVLVDGQCYQISTNSFLVPIGGADAERCKNDENFYRTQIGWSCLATTVPQEGAAVGEPVTPSQGCAPRGTWITAHVFCTDEGELIQDNPADLQSQPVEAGAVETQSRSPFAQRLESTWCQLRGMVYLGGVCQEKNLSSEIPEGGLDWLEQSEISVRGDALDWMTTTQEPEQAEMNPQAQRNLRLFAQMLGRVTATTPVISNIITQSVRTLAANQASREPDASVTSEPQLIQLPCNDSSAQNQPAYPGATRTVQQVCQHLRVERGFSTCTPDRVESLGEVVLCDGAAWERLTDHEREELREHELVHAQLQDRPGRALYDYCQSQGISIDDTTYHQTSFTQESCIGVAELGAQLVSYSGFAEDYGFVLAGAGGEPVNSSATTQQAVNHLQTNCPGVSSDTVIAGLLGDSSAYGQMISACTAAPHELVPDRFRRNESEVTEILDEEIIQVAESEYAEMQRASAENSSDQPILTFAEFLQLFRAWILP